MTSQLLARLDGVRALHEAGVEVLCEPADMPWGERIAYLRDPEGNVVTLVTAGH